MQGVQQIPRDLRIGGALVRQMHAKCLLQAMQQLHAFQAVEAEVAVQKAVEGNRGRGRAMRVQFRHELPHDAE